MYYLYFIYIYCTVIVKYSQFLTAYECISIQILRILEYHNFTKGSQMGYKADYEEFFQRSHGRDKQL